MESEEFVEASLFDLLTAFSQFMAGNLSAEVVHEILQEGATVEQKIALLRQLAREQGKVSFSELFRQARDRVEAVVTFLALLELIRLKELLIRQAQPFGEILILRSEETLRNFADNTALE